MKKLTLATLLTACSTQPQPTTGVEYQFADPEGLIGIDEFDNEYPLVTPAITQTRHEVGTCITNCHTKFLQ